MPIAREVLSAGGGAGLAYAVSGSRSLTVTAAGATQATATALTSALNVITTCTEAAGGVQLPVNDIADSIVVINATANNCRVYPPTGGAFNGGTANVPVTLGANRGTTFYQTSALNYGAEI
jgi:hypothetical protein